jgi:hypothetical protein
VALLINQKKIILAYNAATKTLCHRLSFILMTGQVSAEMNGEPIASQLEGLKVFATNSLDKAFTL